VVREHQSLFDANIVLIEDEASGTQLIQALIADRCQMKPAVRVDRLGSGLGITSSHASCRGHA